MPEEHVKGDYNVFDRTDWLEAAFGAGVTALFGFVTYVVAGDAFIGMAISLLLMFLASTVQNLRGDPDVQ